MLASGKVQVVLDDGFTKTLECGAGFGELAILYGQRRSATIKALEDCLCYKLDGQIFKEVVLGDETEIP